MATEFTDQPYWWQKGILYQIYPRSFQDSNGDGVGDLPGITSRLDYCRWLGVDAIWLSPIYPSPMADFGYDVSDYTDIHPLFGTLDDFDTLIAEAGRLQLKVLLDFVPNHTSEAHPWFQQSRSSRENPRRDWYIWRDPAPDGGPPNNWKSIFGGGAWQWDDVTCQYYLHSYLKEQPDLNWRNPDVQQAMFDVMRFWLNRGVSGFRVDAISRLIKDDQFRDNPPNPDFTPGEPEYHQQLPVYSLDRPDVHEIVRRMRAVIDEYPERMMIGEAYLPLERIVTYHHAGVHFAFNFHLIKLPWEAQAVSELVASYETLLAREHWPNWVLGNHDNSRIASRIGSAQARVAAMLVLTLRGTPTLYYGDEIGMHDVPIPADKVQDPWEKNVPGLGLGRDPERSPMQWNAHEPHAGFTTGGPWLPVADDFTRINVEVERNDPTSILTLYHRLMELRMREPALHLGTYTPIDLSDVTMAYVRQSVGRKLLVVLNFTQESTEVNLPEPSGEVLLSTHLDREGEQVGRVLNLRGSEGIILQQPEPGG